MASPGKVLILVENLSVPFDQRVWREATALTEAGYHVSVICPKGDGFDTASREVIKDVAIYRYRAIEAREGLVSFFLEFAQALVMMMYLSIKVFFREGFDVIQICNPPDMLFLVTLPFKLFGRTVIFDHHDLAPEVYQSKRNTTESNAVHKVLLVFERLTFRFADVVMSTNESYKRVAMTRGKVREEDVIVVRNGPDLKRVVEAPPNPALKQGKPHLVFYIGTMGSQDGVDFLLRSVAHLVQERGRGDFHTVIMGGGVELEYLKRYAQELSVAEHVTFTGRVPDAAVVEALNTADVCACPDPPTPLNNISTMNKTMEYMALGKPVVAFDLVETRVSAGEAALYAAASDEKDFGDQIARLLDAPDLRAKLGAIGKERVRTTLSWEHSKKPLRAAYARAFEKARKPGLAAPLS
jgi:glycosyltransferase involved in cell wall biosynthesis